jgi:hypothetical protein
MKAIELAVAKEDCCCKIAISLIDLGFRRTNDASLCYRLLTAVIVLPPLPQ